MGWAELNGLYLILTAVVSPYFFIHELWFRVSGLAMVTWSEVWWEFNIKLACSSNKLLLLWTKIKFAEISTKMCAAQWAMWRRKGTPCYLLEEWIPKYQGENLSIRGSSWECGQPDEPQPGGGCRITEMFFYIPTRNKIQFPIYKNCHRHMQEAHCWAKIPPRS